MTGKPQTDDTSRERRLAAALRANLKRRKEGVRRRASQDPPAPGTEDRGDHE